MVPNDTVFAALPGKVVEAKTNPSEGNYVVIRHDRVKDGETGKVGTYYSCHLHLSELGVAKDQEVAEGDPIGKTGSTGQSTGEHLHFQIDTSDAPFHPYWPFSFKEARDLNLGFLEAVNKGLGIENARKYTVNPLVFLESASVSGAAPTPGVKPADVKPADVKPMEVKPTEVKPTILSNAVTDDEILIASNANGSVPFSDVSANSAYLKAIAYLKSHGIASGQGGKFLPKSNVTRGEILKMVLLAGKLRMSDSKSSIFSDVPVGDGFLPYVNTAVALKAVSGYPDGTFRPNDFVTRVEGLKIVLGVLKIPLDPVTGPVYADVGMGDWFAPHAQWSRDNEVLAPKGANFLPNAKLTREEVAGIIYVAAGE